LSLNGCVTLTALPDDLQSVQYLDLDGCIALIRLPDLPMTLETLSLNGCLTLTALPDDLQSVQYLNLDGCIALTHLPDLPSTLETLLLNGCVTLTTLPLLPEELVYLGLSGCSNIEFTQELIQQLQDLEESGCIVIYPDSYMPHLPSAHLRERLETLIQANTLSPAPIHMRSILHRFLTDNTVQRGGPDVLIAMIDPLMRFFETEPQHLIWANNIASQYLSGCVNQPVKGICEIAAWAQIAQAPSMHEKLEMARYLLTLNGISEIVSQHPPGANFEVEAANILLCTIYADLNQTQTLEQPWMCIPTEGIAYADSIDHWMNQEVLDKKNTLKDHIQSMDHEAITLQLCQEHCVMQWGELAFPTEIQDIKQHYQTLRKTLETLYYRMDECSDSEDLAACATLFQDLRPALSTLPPIDLSGKTKEEIMTILSQYKEALWKRLSALTQEEHSALMERITRATQEYCSDTALLEASACVEADPLEDLFEMPGPTLCLSHPKPALKRRKTGPNPQDRPAP